MKKWFLNIITHGGVALVGFIGGVYTLPILIAPSAPPVSHLKQMAEHAQYKGEFKRDLKDSDFLHWGEGKVFLGNGFITLEGELAPGPDYKVYLSPEFVDTEADFIRLKDQMVRVGDVKTFHNFSVALPESIDLGRYTTVIVWCESFGQFITAARYQ